MPYIDLRERGRFDTPLAELSPKTAGELNYCITGLCLGFMERNLPNYTMFNEIIGALECAKQEFYRRAVVPYENKKIEQNGDVY